MIVKNKKAQIFMLYLIFITIFFCGFEIFLYFHSQSSIGASLVSPEYVLKLVDSKAIFEVNEGFALKEALCGFENIEDIKVDFYNRIYAYEFFKNGIILRGVVLPNDVFNDKISWINFCNDIYVFNLNNNILEVERKELIKNVEMVGEPQKINFKMNLKYSFSKKYSFDKSIC